MWVRTPLAMRLQAKRVAIATDSNAFVKTDASDVAPREQPSVSAARCFAAYGSHAGPPLDGCSTCTRHAHSTLLFRLFVPQLSSIASSAAPGEKRKMSFICG